jgi:hypothetical protein
MEDNRPILPIVYTSDTDPTLLQTAIKKGEDDGFRVCVIQRPPNPFAADYFPYPQLPIHAKEYPTPQGVTINDQK